MKRLGPWLVIGAGVLLIVGAGVWMLFSWRLANPGSPPVPASVAGLDLAQQTTGREAVAGIAQLHGKEFPLTSGAIATYGAGQATLWVSGVSLNLTAAEMVRTMDERIGEGRSPFTRVGTREADGRPVYELTGMGQRHFYFQSGRLVIWLAADESLAEQAIADVLSFYGRASAAPSRVSGEGSRARG